MKRIAAVIVTYNRKDLLLQSIACVRGQDFQAGAAGDGGAAEDAVACDVLVVDNASSDGTAEALAGLVERGEVRYFNTGANIGGAGGFNYGMRKAVEAGYDFVWVMDDDCLPQADALAALLAADRKLGGSYGYLSSVVRWTDGSICRMNVQRHPLTRNIEDFSPELQPATLASFVSLFVPARVIAEVGLPIKEFFIWTDDWEFTRRVSRAHPCYVVGGSVVTHASKTNGAGTIATDVDERLDRYRLVYRNDVVLYRGEGLKGWAFLAARALLHIGQVLTGSGGNRLKKIGIIVSGNLAGLRFRPPIEHPASPVGVAPEPVE